MSRKRSQLKASPYSFSPARDDEKLPTADLREKKPEFSAKKRDCTQSEKAETTGVRLLAVSRELVRNIGGKVYRHITGVRKKTRRRLKARTPTNMGSGLIKICFLYLTK
ncbi:MAG: hypothetical protein KUG82_03555 [Pseudomonadales bacterium]|nr:hypothetical protein [Pseudomonadales bacterium]